MDPKVFTPGYRSLRSFRTISEYFFSRFLQFTYYACPDYAEMAEASKKKMLSYMKGLISRYIFLNFEYFAEGPQDKADWEWAGKFLEENFSVSDMFVRHVIYNTYSFFSMENHRYPRAAGGTYDTSMVSMLIIVAGKDGIEKYVKEALSERGYPGWMHFWVQKVCRRKMMTFLPSELYRRRKVKIL